MPHCSSEHEEQFESMVGGASLSASPPPHTAFDEAMTHLQEHVVNKYSGTSSYASGATLPKIISAIKEIEKDSTYNESFGEIESAIADIRRQRLSANGTSWDALFALIRRTVEQANSQLEIYDFSGMKAELYKIFEEVWPDVFFKIGLERLLQHFDNLDKHIKIKAQCEIIDGHLFNGSVFDIGVVHSLVAAEELSNHMFSRYDNDIVVFKKNHPYFHSYHDILISSILSDGQFAVSEKTQPQRTLFRSLLDFLKSPEISEIIQAGFQSVRGALSKSSLGVQTIQLRQNVKVLFSKNEDYYRASLVILKNRMLNILKESINISFGNITDVLMFPLINRAIDFAVSRFGRTTFAIMFSYKLLVKVIANMNEMIEDHTKDSTSARGAALKALEEYVARTSSPEFPETHSAGVVMMLNQLDVFLDESNKGSRAEIGSKTILDTQRSQLKPLIDIANVLNYKLPEKITEHLNMNHTEIRSLIDSLHKQIAADEKVVVAARASGLGAAEEEKDPQALREEAAKLREEVAKLRETAKRMADQEQVDTLEAEAETLEAEALEAEAEALQAKANGVKRGREENTSAATATSAKRAKRGGAPKHTTKKHAKKVKSKMLKGKSKKHLKKSKKGRKTGKKRVRFHSSSKKSKKTTRKRR